MKPIKLQCTICLAIAIFAFQNANAQYGQNITYLGNDVTLNLDVYEPTGDTASLRPLIIFACGGNFLTSDKTQQDVVPFCKDLAKRGYVTASIFYRAGMENYPAPGPDSADAADAVFRATHDARAAVRFFRKSVVEFNNPFRIDTNLIFFGGSSAGGFMALHLAYLDDINEKPAYIDTTQVGMGGSIEGNTGNPGYSSKVTGIINMSGAIGDSAWMKPGDTPVLSFHGDDDAVVPFGSALIKLLGFYELLTVDGSASVHEQADILGINNCFKPYYGAGHTPYWGGHPNETEYYDSTLTYMKYWLLQFVCGAPSICAYTANPTDLTNCSTGRYYDPIFTAFDLTSNVTLTLSIDDIAANSFNIKSYPNPGTNFVTISIQSMHAKTYYIDIYDHTGRLVRSYDDVKSQEQIISRDNLRTGLYLVKVSTDKVSHTTKIIFE